MPSSSRAHEIEVAPPFRLDLTVSALRRSSTNLVDLLTGDGAYVRAFEGVEGPVIARVTQARPDALVVRFDGGAPGSADHARALASVRRILGVERDLSRFDRAARRIPWLRAVAGRMRGVKPPRYPTLWEACVNAVLFQQVSLVAASAISRRMTLALGAPIVRGSTTLHAFPGADRLRGAGDDVLRAAGISASKLATLRRVADALQSGGLAEAALERLASPDAAAVLRGIKGIGPWTATVILLRGLGRLDVFPMNDSSVARNLAFLAGATPRPLDALEVLGPQRGMLYYHLLLARLEAAGDLGRVSSALEAG